MTGVITIVWDFVLPGGGHAKVTDASPPLPDLDPTDTEAIVREVQEGLGIALIGVQTANPRGAEVAAWAVRHGETGVIGRMAVTP